MTCEEIGTLQELNLKPGDVVEIVKGFGGFENYAVKHKERHFIVNDEGGADSECRTYNFGTNCSHTFRIISRASDTPRTWGEMTDAEKGALLLAAHEGKVIEYRYACSNTWRKCAANDPSWEKRAAYRIAPPEPKRETVTMTGAPDDGFSLIGETYDTHRITFDLIDGEPDCASIEMERLP